jgi:hypothetical protein
MLALGMFTMSPVPLQLVPVGDMLYEYTAEFQSEFAMRNFSESLSYVIDGGRVIMGVPRNLHDLCNLPD